MWNSIKKMRNKWVSYILRHSNILELIIKGRLEGKIYKCRHCLEYIQQIVKDQEYNSCGEMKRKAYIEKIGDQLQTNFKIEHR